MPTVQQLEQRLNRLTRKLTAAPAGGGDGAVFRLMHKRQRRLQRKLRRARPSPSGGPPASQKAQAAPPEAPEGK
ncbi:MAG: hypothetical protein HY208_07070 [Nitrospirae bacterium]|nr:hypothetical protein [Nitrospirota bacterium]